MIKKKIECRCDNITIGSSAGDSTDGAKIVAAIYDALKEFDTKNITGEKVCVLPPDQYYALLNTSSTTGATWLNKDVGGSGSVSEGIVPQVGGVKIMMSNHLPSTDESSTFRGSLIGINIKISTFK